MWQGTRKKDCTWKTTTEVSRNTRFSLEAFTYLLMFCLFSLSVSLLLCLVTWLLVLKQEVCTKHCRLWMRRFRYCWRMTFLVSCCHGYYLLYHCPNTSSSSFVCCLCLFVTFGGWVRPSWYVSDVEVAGSRVKTSVSLRRATCRRGHVEAVFFSPIPILTLITHVHREI